MPLTPGQIYIVVSDLGMVGMFVDDAQAALECATYRQGVIAELPYVEDLRPPAPLTGDELQGGSDGA